MHWRNILLNNNWQRIIGAGLLLLAIASSWLALRTMLDQTPTKPFDEHQSDSFMENVHATKFNELGNIEAEFFSPKMLHYPVNNITEMASPRFLIYLGGESPPWEITALNGKAYDGIKRLELWEHVVGHHPKSILNPETTIATESVTIFPSQKHAQTQQEIIAKQPEITIKSIGADVDLNTHTIKLWTKVRGEYVPAY